MRWPYVWRKTAEDEVAVWKAEAGRQRRRAEQAEGTARTEVACRRQISEMYDALHEEHERAHGRLMTAPGRAEPAAAFDEKRAQLAAERIARLRRGVARAREEATAEKRRADHLQERLDDAVGLKPFRIEDSRWYQPGYKEQENDPS